MVPSQPIPRSPAVINICNRAAVNLADHLADLIIYIITYQNRKCSVSENIFSCIIKNA